MRWLAIAVALSTLVFLGAGCGGGSDAASTDTETVVATDTLSTDDTSTDETATDETSTDETSTDDTGIDTDSSFNFASEDCQNLVKAYLGLSAAVTAASGGADVSGDVKKFSELTKDVPGEIKGDVQTIAAAYGTYLKKLNDLGLKAGDIPNADQLQQLQDAGTAINSPELTSASDHLSAWTTANCSK